MKLEVIKVGNGSEDYPGNFTKKELQIIKYASKGRVLNLFSGKCGFGNERIDFSSKEATKNMDVFEYIKFCHYYDTIIIDAPYNQRFADKYKKIGNTPKQFIIFADTKKTTYLFDQIYKWNPKVIILKSWNYYIPRGYKLKKGYLCYPGGYRKSTLLLIFVK